MREFERSRTEQDGKMGEVVALADSPAGYDVWLSFTALLRPPSRKEDSRRTISGGSDHVIESVRSI